ncbi:Chromosome partitioning ATPase, Mrp family, contains Fe-S cluster [Parasporobacterium paucivorans DSM 15970]|uniref:Iron-sulfur cluster carrier protein n=1 Tax=Parasporobacterium paucivorans DSM 15970 TaxID=1122934 RepID=A0A1M6I555_9FIRM|nr:Mrp/NBP35 family ATP-binding protein [Parasporobacterium paucivorans]SHJ29552.1 Chromosome partitioning ATPase, Mrp family, contains Fe-S cluster [Parasporobacterium paucivorans DSM 15970]
MMEQNRDCADNECTKESCEGCEQNRKSMMEALNQYSSVKHVIGVASGKGGVGKSFVTAMLAVLLNRKGYKVGILDADITGPSIPKMFGISKRAEINELGFIPERTAGGIKLMSINLLLEQEDMPVIWRGPILAGTVKQFWTDVVWEDLDYLLIDMPPGTGDVPLTVFQSIPLDGIVIVSSPQDLVSMIVRKAYNMAKQMDIPVLGLVENMSSVKCPDCGKEINLFGESKLPAISREIGVDILGRLPIDPKLAELVDKGEFERFSSEYLADAVEKIEKL